ncbi:uncharacterized protein LOC124797386 isoform X1 [Schistocerca piceifrons]|uniref:uncharacterized protein LOC124797386 isoform X1 n=1 Tax=Schistocerca piceifrons TaxID=274613 RepID=UPI001F5FB883|nr:uncharacterized protein LOC124797386 isoform X1 [Schistocerca piceifrons]XP_049956729.1 uncharacterized protein LOC126473605 isoform X1 [Schistocerca serialis cubense]
MTSTPREGRPWNWWQLVFFLLVVVTPLMFSAALATPVQPDGESEAEKDADPILQYLKRYISKMGYIFGEDTSANLLPFSTSTLDDGEEDTDLAPERAEMTRHREDEEFAPIERIFWGEREDETKTSTTPKSPSSDGNDKPKQLDPWSLVWYIGSFGGLVAFFLAVSCSECCCHKPAGSQAAGAAGGAGAGLDEPPRLPAVAEGPPPPPYSMFAPPPYDSLCYGVTDEKDKLEVFVVPVPVHSAGVSPQSAYTHTHSYSQSHSQPP